MKRYTNLPKLETFEVYAPSKAPVSQPRPCSSQSVETLTRGQLAASWICRVIAAAIMIETLFFKFTGAPESVYIFSKMAMESWGRYGQGVWELIASLLLLAPQLAWAGGILTLGALGAAIVSHLTVLGIEVQGDHGLLFAMALITFICGFVVTFLHRNEIPSYTPMTPY